MKINFIPIIVLLIFLLSSFVGVSNDIEETSLQTREIDTKVYFLYCEKSRSDTLEKALKTSGTQSDSTIINDSEYDDFHPILAGDNRGRFFTCFERTWDGVDYYPDFWCSLDNGVSWEEIGYFSESVGCEFPDADSNDNGFYATVLKDYGQWDNEIWLIYSDDLPHYIDYRGILDEWYPFRECENFLIPAISCYTRVGESWNFGGISFVCDILSPWYSPTCPCIYYENGEYGGVLTYIWSDNFLNSDIAINEVTEMSYAVWDNEVDANLLVRKDNFGEWDAQNHHPHIGSWSIGDGITNLSNPSIEAHNNAIIIVCEEEDNIVCFYSDNGFSSIQKNTVVNSAKFPEVKVTFDGNVFVCSYVKDGAVYCKKSENGGANWIEEQKVQDSQAVSEFGSHDLGKGKDGIYAVWEDNRGDDRDIYFGQAYDETKPEIDIISIKGRPVGIIATIENIGNAEATNVKWTMTVIGGILSKINKNSTGTVETLAINCKIYANYGLILGLGPIAITVTVECDEGLYEIDYAKGIQIFIFSLIS